MEKINFENFEELIDSLSFASKESAEELISIDSGSSKELTANWILVTKVNMTMIKGAWDAPFDLNSNLTSDDFSNNSASAQNKLLPNNTSNRINYLAKFALYPRALISTGALSSIIEKSNAPRDVLENKKR